MKRRRHSNPDSLELLLDTMCNTFGGIIMIALLIALLSRDASSENSTQQPENLQRQTESIEQQTTEADRLRQRLLQGSDPNISQTFKLLSDRDELRQQIESRRANIQSNQSVLASIPFIDPAEIERLQSELESRTNELKILQQQIERDTQARQRALRLPRERAIAKKTHYLIVRYGKIYPVHTLREGQRELNTQTLAWSQSPGGETASPKREMGLDTATGLPILARLFNDIPSQTYSIHFLVYADSFPAFLAARQIPLGRNYDTGWEFLTEDRPVVFSSQGQAPPAL